MNRKRWAPPTELPVVVIPVVTDALNPYAPYPSMPMRTESYELKRVGIGRARRTADVYILQGVTDADADWLLLMYIEKGEADAEE